MTHHSNPHFNDTRAGRSSGRRGGPRRRGPWHDERGGHRRGQRGADIPGHRARRGAVRDGIVLLLGDRPMHGYELITELESRSGGRWRPSPGAIYPALDKMEQRGLITGAEIDGKRRYTLTDRGRELLEVLNATTDAPAPWDATPSERGEMRRQLAELAGQLRQIGRFGTDAQRDAAATILDVAVRDLYTVLAARPDDDTPPSTAPSTPQGDTAPATPPSAADASG